MDLNNFRSAVSSHQSQQGFIKVSDSPLSALDFRQKALLNRKGNELFNCGKIEEASRIFIATGYSDGLTRVGDIFISKNKPLYALKFYILAKNQKKIQPLIEKAAKTLSALINNKT